jgi:hypothetical protein
VTAPDFGYEERIMHEHNVFRARAEAAALEVGQLDAIAVGRRLAGELDFTEKGPGMSPESAHGTSGANTNCS